MSPTALEVKRTFDCFGSTCEVLVGGEEPQQRLARVAHSAQRRLEEWHARFSRFIADSELCRLNEDPHETVRVSPLMARLVQAVKLAGSVTGGLVDCTLVEQIESAGYSSDLLTSLPLAKALAQAPARSPARPGAGSWREIEVDLGASTVRRPPGVRLDSGGVAKGLFADVLAHTLAEEQAFAINCAGDLAIGGAAAVRRAIAVQSPFDDSTLHTFELAHTGVATSGIGRRSWLDADGRPAHHLLDPATGRPAFTGVVQATALAPSALMAEVYAKAALLSGPQRAPSWLRHGGVLVFDDGSHRVTEAGHNARGARDPNRAGDRPGDGAVAGGRARAGADADANRRRGRGDRRARGGRVLPGAAAVSWRISAAPAAAVYPRQRGGGRGAQRSGRRRRVSG